SKDKCKAKMIEPEKPLKKKDQIKFNEEEALRLQAKFDEEDKLARDKAQQAQEQQELTIEEKSTLFIQLLEKRKKHFAAKRAEEKRNRPPTRAQQRNIMCTYLKNMAGWKPKDLNNKSFANIQELFDKAFKRVNTFVDFKTELVEGTKMEESSQKAEVMEESNSKRAGDELQQESTKKQKMDDDQERVELQSLMNVIHDEEEIAVDAIPLATKPPSIVDWKIVKEAKISYDQIIRAYGSSRRPEEGYERVLWGNLKTMFEHHVEDAVWKNLRESKVLVWKLFDSYRVRFVRFQNLFLSSLQSNSRINKVFGSILLVIMKLLMKKLDDFEDKYQVLGRIVGIKRHLDDLRDTIVKLMLLVYKLLLLVFRVNAAGTKLQLLKDYNC
ncbi:hypothetical protein Tco_0123109, partial [Tanacetum coccineum]